MNELIAELYNLSEGLDENRYLYQSEYQTVAQSFSSLMDQVDAAMGRSFHETLYNAVMEYLIFEQHKSFLWGLRLGLQLQTL